MFVVIRGRLDYRVRDRVFCRFVCRCWFDWLVWGVFVLEVFMLVCFFSFYCS